MNEELEKEFYFLRNFVIEHLENLQIEKIIVCEELKTGNVIYVYLKVFGKNWQKYFLDAGAGFWEDAKTSNYNELDDIEADESFVFKDYTQKLRLEGNTISKIYCEPNDENCRIIIKLNVNGKIVLRCINSKVFDSGCEITIE